MVKLGSSECNQVLGAISKSPRRHPAQPRRAGIVSFNEPKLFFILSVTIITWSLLACQAHSLRDGIVDDEETTVEPIITDGFLVDQESMEENINENLRSREEQEKEAEASAAANPHDSERHPFDKACPHNFFRCENGECIAHRWRCDGHADCDDFSDELNCTIIDLPGQSSQLPSNLTSAHISKILNTSLLHPGGPTHMQSLEFNSTIEPLMLFSTGQSIRGLWMRSHLYFDVITKKQSRSSSTDSTGQPSITEAFSLFFGMLGLDPSRAAASSLLRSSTDSSKSTGGGEQESNSKPESTIVGLDMNPTNKEVFWVELGKDPGVYSAIIDDEQFEARQRRQMHGYKKIVEFGLLSPEDIALDTVGRNIYITDAGLPAVVVCSYVHVHCTTLVQNKIHKPRAIIADSSSGWIIYTDWGDRPGIFMIGMDGKRRETLIETDVVWPNGLAQDPNSNYLYWADARLNKIERVDLRTKKRIELVKEVGTNPFSVSVFEDRVYWSDWSGNEIRTCDKDTGNNTRAVLRATDIYGIHIYHPDLQRTVESRNPCWSKRCSHLCLLSPAPQSSFGFKPRGQTVGASCACPDSMSLSILDRSTCYEVHLSFLLVNTNNYIAQVFPERIGQRIVEEIVYSQEYSIQDVASDWTHYKLFFFDASRKQIYTADFSTRQTRIQKFVSITSKTIRGLTYDFPSDNLYWIDPELGTLTMNPVHGFKFQKVLRRDLQHATSLALDSKNRVFYISIMGAEPRIIRTDIMANEASDVVVMAKDKIGLPIALNVDEAAQRLYWADVKYGQIESVELDVKSRDSGTRPGTRIRHRSRLGTILSFTVYHDYLMWFVQDSDYLFRARKDDRNSRAVPFKTPPNIARHGLDTDYRRLLTLHPSNEIFATSQCMKRGCSHACIVDRDREPKCLCPDGMKVQMSNRTNCIDANKPDPASASAVEGAPLKAQAISKLLASSVHKQPMSTHQVDELTHAKPSEPGSRDVVVMDHSSVIPSHVKQAEMPHVVLEGELKSSGASVGSSAGSAATEWLRPQAVHEAQEQNSKATAAAATMKQQTEAGHGEQPARGSKLVWLITFLVVLIAGGLITIVSLMILNKQGRLPRNMSQLKVSFISPGSSTSAGLGAAAGSLSAERQSGKDNDKTMLLLDTDS